MTTLEEWMGAVGVPIIRRVPGLSEPYVVMGRLPVAIWANVRHPGFSQEAVKYLNKLERIGEPAVIVTLPDDGQTYRIDIANPDGTHRFSIDAGPPMTAAEVDDILSTPYSDDPETRAVLNAMRDEQDDD